MEWSWFSFLRSSSVIDFAFMLLALLTGFILIVTAVVVLIKAKRRMPVYLLLAAALLPFLIGLAGGAYRLYRSERLLAVYNEDIVGEDADRWHRTFQIEFLVMCLMGTPGTVVTLLIAMAALFLKKPQAQPDAAIR